MRVEQTIVAWGTIGQSDVDPKGVVIHSQPRNTENYCLHGAASDM